MEIRILCGTPIGENEEIVLSYLRSCNKWPSIEEIISETGLGRSQVKKAFVIIRQQMRLADNREKLKNFLGDLND